MSYLDRKDYETYGNACIHGEKPPCVCGCPLNIDIPKIAENLQGGRISAAYRTFRDQALFPAIVSRICDAPCGGVCCRNDKDSPVEIKLLEQAIVAHTENREPNRFNLPAKNRKIAIIGGGLAGLSVAVFMGTKNYEVTVYEGADQPGGRLRHMLAPEDYLAEIALQLKYANCTIEINSPIKTLDDLTFDAAFIGTGAGGHDFGLAAGVDRKGFGTAREGVFLGGALLGAAPVEDIAQAFTAAYSMEKYLKIGKMDGIPETFRVTESVITKDPESYAETGVVLPAASEGYTKEEATAEANRCLKCDCTLCSDACQLFGFFDRMPAQISQEAFSSLHTKKSLTKQNAT